MSDAHVAELEAAIKDLELENASLTSQLKRVGAQAAKMESLYYREMALCGEAMRDKDALRLELSEEARINGMGGEREAALLGKIERIKKAIGLVAVEAGIYRGIPEMDKIEQMAMDIFEGMEG